MLNRLKKRVASIPRVGALLVIMVVFAAVGLAVAGSSVKGSWFEAETGSATGTAAVIADVTAAGGNAITFNASQQNNSYADVPSNFNVADHIIPNGPDYSVSSSASEPTGNFRIECHFSNLGYTDPIVYPGQENKGHLHMFFGNEAVTGSSTYASLRSTGDGSCAGGPINRTGYWMPAVFDANDSNKIVVPNFYNIYYKAETCGGPLAVAQACIQNYHDLPNGLRMIAGHDMTQPAGGGQDFAWYCDSPGFQKQNTIPNSCPNNSDLYVAVYFPDCWDGVNLDSANHRDHVRHIYYDPNTGQPTCPSGYPVKIPDITEFAIWQKPGDTSGWSLSSDHMAQTVMPRGSSFHADWFGAWDNGVKSQWFNNCLRGMKNSSSGMLCGADQTRLQDAAPYTGPMRIPGYMQYFK